MFCLRIPSSHAIEIEIRWPCKSNDAGQQRDGLFKAIFMLQMVYGCHYLIEKVRYMYEELGRNNNLRNCEE